MGREIIIIGLFTLALGNLKASGQARYVTGKVTDKITQETIPFASIHFIGTVVGTTTDANGNFSFTLNKIPSDSLSVNELGYQATTLPVNRHLKTQTINFLLTRKNLLMSELVVHGGVNPALILLRQIIRHKPENNPDYLSNFKSQVYDKLEVDLDNINKNKFEKSAIFKPFVFILNNIDSTSEGETFLPVFLSETSSDYYYQRMPKKEKEIIVGTRRSGLKSKSLTQFLGGMYQKVNVYDNFIPVFGKEFPSPISDFATAYYDYKLTDTQFIGGRKCFRVSFGPKRKGGNTFIGDFWVNDTTYAIVRMNMEISKDANINFVKNISLFEEYSPLSATRWFQTKSKLVADFILTTKKSMGMIARATTVSKPVLIDNLAVTDFLNQKEYQGNNIFILPDASNRNDNFWQQHRLENLTKNEDAIYQMVDTLQKMPVFKEYTGILRFLTTGRKQFGPIAVGPYYYLFNINPLEKFRLRVGLNTTSQFSKNIYLYGYLAYGFGDRKFKGGIGGRWYLNRNPYTYIGASYLHDLDNGSYHHHDGVGVDNIFAFAVRKPGTIQKFVMRDEKKIEFYRDLGNGLSSRIYLAHTRYSPYAPLPVGKDFSNANVEGLNPLNDTKVGIKLRYAYHEKFLNKNSYDRISLGSKYPILEIDYTKGFKDVLGSNYSYQKAGVSIYGKVKIPPLGTLHYDLYGKRIFGTLPYLLLEIHQGNGFYYYNRHAFNTMNRYEFISDKYMGFYIEHDLGGGIFNFIPGVRKLKLRQFWTADGVMGGLSNANQQLNLHNNYIFQTLNNHPYVEVGTGVENIFQLIRIECIWRVTPLNLPTGVKDNGFGVFGSLKLEF